MVLTKDMSVHLERISVRLDLSLLSHRSHHVISTSQFRQVESLLAHRAKPASCLELGSMDDARVAIASLLVNPGLSAKKLFSTYLYSVAAGRAFDGRDYRSAHVVVWCGVRSGLVVRLCFTRADGCKKDGFRLRFDICTRER